MEKNFDSVKTRSFGKGFVLAKLAFTVLPKWAIEIAMMPIVTCKSIGSIACQL